MSLTSINISESLCTTQLPAAIPYGAPVLTGIRGMQAFPLRAGLKSGNLRCRLKSALIIAAKNRGAILPLIPAKHTIHPKQLAREK
jgi:hypothetical protein